MKAFLGEILIATYEKTTGNKWQIEPKSLYSPTVENIIKRNLYASQTHVEECVSFLVPEECRPFIRWMD